MSISLIFGNQNRIVNYENSDVMDAISILIFFAIVSLPVFLIPFSKSWKRLPNRSKNTISTFFATLLAGTLIVAPTVIILSEPSQETSSFFVYSYGIDKLFEQNNANPQGPTSYCFQVTLPTNCTTLSCVLNYSPDSRFLYSPPSLDLTRFKTNFTTDEKIYLIRIHNRGIVEEKNILLTIDFASQFVLNYTLTPNQTIAPIPTESPYYFFAFKIDKLDPNEYSEVEFLIKGKQMPSINVKIDSQEVRINVRDYQIKIC